MNGFLLIDKPTGMSSFGVVARVRRVLSQRIGKKVKVGHTGTLDPFASGLMIIVVGDYCKRAQEFSKMDKSYLTTLAFGQNSSTGDPEGELTSVSDSQPDIKSLEAALQSFRGQIKQTPPSFSAIKIDGVRAYKLARAGLAVEMPQRQVTISRLELQNYDYPQATLECLVSSGTYIRTLVQDIGESLGVGAYCQSLRRTTVGEYDLKDASNLDDLMRDGATFDFKFL